MLLIIKLCRDIYPTLVIKNSFELNAFVDKICIGLMDKIGDNNARLREKSEKAALSMAAHPSIGS